MMKDLKIPESNIYFNQLKSWSEKDIESLLTRYNALKEEKLSDKESFEILSKEFGRGRFSILNVVKANKGNTLR